MYSIEYPTWCAICGEEHKDDCDKLLEALANIDEYFASKEKKTDQARALVTRPDGTFKDIIFFDDEEELDDDAWSFHCNCDCDGDEECKCMEVCDWTCTKDNDENNT